MQNNYNWTLKELQNFYELSLIKLICQANFIHQQYHQPDEIQVCNLISIKTGGCPEDCKYCSQSSKYQTSTSAQPLMSYEEAINAAQKAKEQGATRVCLGAAWRGPRDGKQFEETIKIIKEIAKLDIEICCTFGMLQPHQAQQLKKAGVYAYNHNLDTSENFYKTIVSSHTFQDRLNTLDIVEKSGLSVCCGGILGLGESHDDRLELLLKLAQRNPHPESVPINRLTPIPGTPLEKQTPIPFFDMLRIIAIARIIMPTSIIRLSAGRVEMSTTEHLLCFLVGANSIFSGEKLLTVGNMLPDQDEVMFKLLGLSRRKAFKKI